MVKKTKLSIKRVAFIGLGYIGLPTALLAVESGYTVLGYDIDKDRVREIERGICPFIEPELKERLDSALRTGRFTISTKLEQADCYVIAVPTPCNQNKKADLNALFNVGTTLATVLSPGALVIIESTVPIGTTKRFSALLSDISGLVQEEDFFVTHCPERVIPGRVFHELITNQRVIGGSSEYGINFTRHFYKRFVQAPCYTTQSVTAEMVKLVENSSRDVQIAFANQVAGMCQTAGIDPFDVIKLANKHPRVNVLYPGCGVGGHCIAVDPWFLIECFPHDTTLLKTARMINDAKPHTVIASILECVRQVQDKKGKKYKPTVSLLGVTFKPDIDDLRESPALKIAKELFNKHASLQVQVCEPHVAPDILHVHGIEKVVQLSKAVKNADVVVALVKHRLFDKVNATVSPNALVVDVCGLLSNGYSSKQQMPQSTVFSVKPNMRV